MQGLLNYRLIREEDVTSRIFVSRHSFGNEKEQIVNGLERELVTERINVFCVQMKLISTREKLINANSDENIEIIVTKKRELKRGEIFEVVSWIHDIRVYGCYRSHVLIIFNNFFFS